MFFRKNVLYPANIALSKMVDPIASPAASPI